MKLRNKGSDAVSLYRPAGDPGALTVEPGQECEVAGVQVNDDVPADAIVVRLPDGELRAYSTDRWEAVTDMDASPAEVPVPKFDRPKIDVDAASTEVSQPATAKDEG